MAPPFVFCSVYIVGHLKSQNARFLLSFLLPATDAFQKKSSMNLSCKTSLSFDT